MSRPLEAAPSARRSADDAEDWMAGRDAQKLGVRGIGADAPEELFHLPRPLLEVGAQDRRLLLVGHLLDAHTLGLAALGG